MFQKGNRVELISDVNAIPAGRYCVDEESEEFFILRCGDNIQIGISTDCRSLLRGIDSSVPLTRQQDFLERYFRLLREMQNRPGDPLQPFTFCGMNPMNPLNRFYQEQYMASGGEMFTVKSCGEESPVH